MKTIADLLKRVAELATQYLSAVPPQAPDANGRVWNDSIALFSGRDGIQSLASYVAKTLELTKYISFEDSTNTARAYEIRPIHSSRSFSGHAGIAGVCRYLRAGPRG